MALLPDDLKQRSGLSYYDFYDRIINLKFTFTETISSTQTKLHNYILRSDYELYYPNLDLTKSLNVNAVKGNSNKARVRKVIYKPSIKVSYKNVATNAHIQIDVYISNFYMFDSQGNRFQNINATSYRLSQFQLAMGYFGQFEQFPHETVADLFDFKSGYNVEVLTCSCDVVTTESLPPDYTLHIRGFIGQTASGRVYSTPKGYDSITSNLIAFEKQDNKTAIENLYFNRITKNYYREMVNGKIKTTEPMSKSDALKYGVRVFCTDKVKQMSTKQLEQKMITSDGSEVTYQYYTNIGETPLNTLIAGMGTLFPASIKYKQLYTGDFLAYSMEEVKNLESLLDEVNTLLLAEGFSESKVVKLPAVYNITFQSGLCQITAPYYGLYNFGTQVKFKSRYLLTDLVAYYSGNAGDSMTFFVYNQEVTFATTENVNQCIMNLTKKEDSDD